MNFRHFRYAVAVAETLNFRKAADQLHIAQPALSMQIKALEEELGGLIFTRSSRKVELTAAGRIFIAEAKRTLAKAEQTMATTRRALAGEVGRIELACSGSAAYTGLVGAIIRKFRGQRPQVEIRLRELDPKSQLHELQAGSLQAGFMTNLALQLPETLQKIAIASWPLCVAVADSHPLAGASQIEAAQLVHESFIVYTGTREDDGRVLVEKLTGIRPLRTQQADSAIMGLTLVGANLGVAILPSPLAPIAATMGVRLLPFQREAVFMRYYLVYHGTPQDPALQSFIDCLQTMLADPASSLTNLHPGKSHAS